MSEIPYFVRYKDVTTLDSTDSIYLDDATSRDISYGNKFRAIGVTLPTSTTESKTTYLRCVYNATDSKFDVILVSTQA